MKNYKLGLLICMGLLVPMLNKAQSVLSLEEAIQTALKNNYDIRIQQYAVEISAKQVDPSLVGRQPSIDLNASYEFGWADANTETLNLAPNAEGNNVIELNGISNDIIIAPEISMLLLDGKASLFRLDQLSTVSQLSRWQLQQVMEQTVAEVSAAYLEMAQQQSLIDITQKSIQFTQDRLARARQDAKYGTSGSLQELQIEVDLKTDSASLRSLFLGRDNARRNLNRLMGQDIQQEFSVDTEIALSNNLDLSSLEEQLKENSSLLKLGDSNIKLANIDYQLSEAAFKPTLQGYANLSYVNLQDDANFLQSNRVLGPNIGVRFKMPLYDGGARKIRREVAQMTQEQRQLERLSTEDLLLKDLRNAFAVYQNTLQQLRIERSNLRSFERNLENMQNMYRLGTATNTDVRAAQLNLNAAQNRINNYQYTIKQAEVNLYLLSGQLIQ